MGGGASSGLRCIPEASNDIADYIVGFYNAARLHSKPGNMSPNAFERESTLKKSIELSEIT